MWTGPAPMFPFDAKRCEWLAMYMISHYCEGFITNWGVTTWTSPVGDARDISKAV